VCVCCLFFFFALVRLVCECVGVWVTCLPLAVFHRGYLLFISVRLVFFFSLSVC
jgi:hypothetical protein